MLGCKTNPKPLLFVLPFSKRDYDQAVELLDWISDLGGCKEHPCLLVPANHIGKEELRFIGNKAGTIFSKLDVAYPPHPLPDESWPKGANWLFNTAARYIQTKKLGPWWWNEPDCIPLCEHWLDEISIEYHSAGQPFMGFLVKGAMIKGRLVPSSLNGCAVYPEDAMTRFNGVDLVNGDAWDIAVGNITVPNCHVAATIQHFWGEMGNPPTFREHKRKGDPPNVFTVDNISPTAVVFHRCKDSSLIRLLKGEDPDPAKRFVTGAGPTRSVIKQTDWPGGFFEFTGTCKLHFNAGLVDWQGSRWLATRRQMAQSEIALFRLGKLPCPPIFNESGITIRFPNRAFGENYEDPRVITHNGELIISCANWTSPLVHQLVGKVNRVGLATPYHPVYGKNGSSRTSNTGVEKNWLWFTYADTLHFVYQSDPHTVCFAPDISLTVQEFKAPGIKWSYGMARGGTPPVLLGEHYWSFFHSSIDIAKRWEPPPRRRYYMGIYAFEAKPPFTPVYMTKEPLLVGSESDPRFPHAPLCVFPCGALCDNGVWLVTLGVNDYQTAWLRIPHTDLEKRLSPV